jgi:transcriptional regulator GlxA family with amidase domain
LLGLAFAVAFALPPLLVIMGNAASGSMLTRQQLESVPHDLAMPAPPAYDPSKKTALVVAGNTATESSDLLGPYEVLATSGQFNVYVVAPERTLTPLIPIPQQNCCGTLDLAPHFSFAEYERTIGVRPDVVVVPYIPYASTTDSAVLDWLRQQSDDTLILSICAGSQMVADAGLLAGQRAASHHTMYPILEESHPEVSWLEGLRFVDDGRIVSSAGVTSGVDASLYTLQRLFGRQVALDTAARMGYPHTRFLDDPTWVFTDARSRFPAVMPNAFRTDRTEIGLVLYDGVREVELSSITDAYPRSTAADVLSLAPERTFVKTAHGLDLLPRFDFASAPNLDRVLVPGTPDAAVAESADRWAAARSLRAERIQATGGYAYDLTLRDLARQETRPVAIWAAAWLEYPTADLELEGRDWQVELIARALAMGVLGVLVLAAAPRVIRELRQAPRLLRTSRRPAAGEAAV